MILHKEDDHDFGENQNPVIVQLHNDETIKDGYKILIMIFLINANGFCQHASNDWIRCNDPFGNSGILKKVLYV